jgi:hypothetical protein
MLQHAQKISHNISQTRRFFGISRAFLEEFSRSTAGKTLKRVLRETYWAGKDTRI